MLLEAKQLGRIVDQDALTRLLVWCPLSQEIKQLGVDRLGGTLGRVRPIGAPQQALRCGFDVCPRYLACIHVRGAKLAVLIWLSQFHPDSPGVQQTTHRGETRMTNSAR